MRRVVRWIVPVMALGLAIGLMNKVTRADDTPAAKKTGSVAGIVKGTDGKPVVGAHVALRVPHEHNANKPTGTAAGDKPHHKAVAEGTTDGDGKFTLSDIEPGSYVINAGLKGHGWAHANVSVEADKTTTVELTLQPKDKPNG